MKKRSVICGAIVAAALVAQPRAQSLTPYLGSPVSVPGMILAGNFDNGGEGVAYHDTSSGNTGGAYRSTGVDLAASSEGGNTIGWIAAGEWVNYTVNISSSGSYTAQLRVAAPSAGAILHIGFNKSPGSWTAVSIPATGGWQTWSTVSVPLTLVAGVQQMTLLFDNGGLNISSVNVVASGGGGSSGGSGSAYTGSPAPVPGTIQAANFDNGAEGVAYHDASAINEGGAYRQTGVDLAASSEGGYTIGWISSGEWVNYAVNVAASGAYTAQIRVAAPSAGGTLHIGFSASAGSWTQASVPATGGWQTWTTVNVPMTLTAGNQTMTLQFDAGGYNVSYVKMVSGSSGTPTPPPSGSAPAGPNSPNIPPGTSGVTTTPNLSWQSSGATSYDVYLGTANPPPLAISNISNYWWSPTPALGAGTTYNWQVIAKNASGSTPGPIWSFKTAGGSSTPPPPPPPPPSGNGRLRVMTWNIHSGFDASNVYVLAQQVSFMAAQNVDVIVLQEVQTWDENQPARIPALIQQATGQTWNSVWVPGTGCQTSSGCAGDLMLSRLPIAASNTGFTGISGMGRLVVNVGGVAVNIVDIHLEYYDTNLRTTELLGMMAWARSFGGPRLVGGDFNSWWGEYWIGQMKTEHSDTWLDVTGNQDGGYTTGNVRFDYWFRAFDGAGRLTPLTCSVPSTALSDHRPVVAEYGVQ